MSTTVRAATRIDLAGGTLDLWPLSILIPGAQTINCAIDLWAQATAGGGAPGEMRNDDSGRSLPAGADAFSDPDFALAAECLRHFSPGRKISLATKTEAPRGSGLGNSSALAAAIALALIGEKSQEALAEIDGARMHALVAVLHDLEARVLKTPTGVQDYYPALAGGLNRLNYFPGRIELTPVAADLAELAERLVIFSTGISHHSGLNNWEIYKAAISGEAAVLDGLKRIAEVADQAGRALELGNWPAVGVAVAAEWQARRELAPVVSSPAIDALLEGTRAAGAWGAKLCGAGGGGCGFALGPPAARAAIAAAVTRAGAAVLAAHPSAAGFSVEFGG